MSICAGMGLGSRGHGEEERESAADGPVEVLEAVDAMGVVGEETTLVAVDGGLVEEHGREEGVGPSLVRVGGEGGVEEVLELALLADDGADEDVVVLEQRVRRRRAARLDEQLRGQVAVLVCRD